MDHVVQVRSAAGWQSLGSFPERVAALDYGRALKARHPSRSFRVAPKLLTLLKNPAARLDAVDVDRATSLASRFLGRPVKSGRMIARPKLPDALVCIGNISVIQYVAERDGRRYEFRHPFRAGSRPLMCVTPDGKLVLALSGAWTFTEDGFVDR